MNIPEQLDPTLSRCAKQVYHHLGLPNRSALLNKATLPLEVKKMKTLMSLDTQELVNVVKTFLKIPSQDDNKKTLGDFTKLLDNCLSVYVTPDYEEAEADSAMTEDDEFLDSGIDESALIELTEKAVKRPPSYQVDIPQKRIKIAEALMTPPASPFDNFAEQDLGDFNILSSPPSQTKLFKDIPWLIIYEIGRFVATCKVNWRDISFETFKAFFEIGSSNNPQKLFDTMMEWNHERRGMTKFNGLSYSLMERCPQSVWSFFQSSQENNYRAIRYSGYITWKSTNKPPIIYLLPPTVSASNRFFRKFGYDRFLELKLKDTHASMISKQQDFFLKPFLLMHRTFKFLYVKDDTIILFATEGPGLEPISIKQVVDWHIPITENWKMTMSKFASRMSLGYSNSTSTVQFKPNQIKYIDDVFSGQQSQEETCMTDGCGIISYSAMKKVMEIQGMSALPCAIQCRIAGAKGIWIIDPKLDAEAGDFIQIRSSQDKFKTGLLQDNMDLDPLHYTLDFVKEAFCIYPSYLNTQFIQSLAAGGVPTKVFQDILIEYIKNITSAAVENRNIKVIRDWVARVGHIMKSRWEMEDKIEKSIWKEDILEEIEGDELSEELSSNDEVESVASSTHTSSTVSTSSFNRMNELSGMPSNMHEFVVRMLDSGFDLSNGVVASRITRIFQSVIQQITTRYRIEVAQSCTVTCIPDPTGTLKADEIFLQLSSRRKDEKTGIRSGIILGDVIVTRNPCGLKSDVQKVKAIDCPALRMYIDVIVFPIKGDRSLASKLSGGDYDGDIVFCCWDERIVEPFQNSAPTFDSKRVNAAFSVDKTTVGQEVSTDRNNVEKIIQKNFISVVVPDGTLGIYENWRTILSEKKSLGDEDVLYLSQMCAKLVDAPKQGLRLKDTVRATDRNLYGKIPPPTWFADKRRRQRKGSLGFGDKKGFQKQIEKPETTMDHLYMTLVNQTETNIRNSTCMFRDEDIISKDEDLTAPWLNFKKRALSSNNKDLQDDMALIESLVSKNYEEYCQQLAEFYDERSRLADKANTYDSELTELDLVNTFSVLFELEEYATRKFWEIPYSSIKSVVLNYDIQANSAGMLQNIKASLAYILCSKSRKNSKYCFVVAFDTLRRLKADACAKRNESGVIAPTLVGSMYRALNIDRSWIRKLKDSDGYDQSDNQIVRMSD